MKRYSYEVNLDGVKLVVKSRFDSVKKVVEFIMANTLSEIKELEVRRV